MCLSPQTYRDKAIETYQRKLFVATPAMLTAADIGGTDQAIDIEPSRIPEVPSGRNVFLPCRARQSRAAFPVAAVVDICVLDLRDGGALALANRLRKTSPPYIIRVLKGVIDRCREDSDVAQRLRRQCERAEICLEDWLDYLKQQRDESEGCYACN